VRVLVDGAWGFASSGRLDAAEVDRVAGLAVRIARASAMALRHRVQLDDRPSAIGRYETPLEEDSFALPMDAKIDLLLEADGRLNEVRVLRRHHGHARGQRRPCRSAAARARPGRLAEALH